MAEELFRSLARRDGRYSYEAFRFLNESLAVAIRLAGKEELDGPDRHVTGQQVLAGMRELAIERFGPLAAQVWRSWGIQSTRDWGEIVFLLVDEKMLASKLHESFDVAILFAPHVSRLLHAALRPRLHARAVFLHQLRDGSRHSDFAVERFGVPQCRTHDATHKNEA